MPLTGAGGIRGGGQVGRPPKKVDPSAGPAARFAIELRALREQAGNLPYWKMARRCQGTASKSALAQAAAGRQIPSERVLDAFVSVCGGDLDWWRARREQALSELEAASQPGTQLVPLTRQTPALPTGTSDGTPGSDDDSTQPALARRQPSDVVSPADRGQPADVRSAATGHIDDDIVDAEIVRDSLLRRVLAVTGRRTPLYVAGIAALVTTTAVVTVAVQDSASTTTAARPYASTPPRIPASGGVGGGLPTPAASGSGSPSASAGPSSAATPRSSPPVTAPKSADGAPASAPPLGTGRTRQSGAGGAAKIPRPSSTAAVYRVTGADSKGLAVQSEPHVNHVIRWVPNGTTLHIVCQTDHGDWVDDRWQYGRHFTTWDQLADGTWVYDWYANTPPVDPSGYSPGIPPCPGG
jgi:hypothetical protein